MKSCDQNELQTIYDHGVSVAKHLEQLLDYVESDKPLGEDWKVPEWLTKYREQLGTKLLPRETILEYALFHDVGKPQCKVYDDEGKHHFPDHANVSANYWLESGGDQEIGELIRRDMDIHLLKNDGVEDFSKSPYSCTLLLSGLAEVHSNALMFGGLNSTSFKIKWKQIRKRGNAVCSKLFERAKK